MSRPPKPALVLASEKKSHRTKQEIEHRTACEHALESGTEMKVRKSVRENKVANKEFSRIKKLLKNIQKCDALYESVINRYCLLLAECEDYEIKREKFYDNILELEQQIPLDERTLVFYTTLAAMQTQMNGCDKQLMAKRKMMLDIEKENIMTIAAALRSIPKNPEEESEADPMAELLKRRQA